jgi:hypothetical protein
LSIATASGSAKNGSPMIWTGMPALIASHLTVETELDMSQSSVGKASLALSRLGGLLADGAVLGTDPADYALRLESAHVEDDIILTGASVILVNLLTDIAYAAVDPRIRNA